jgi:hypothetical protein
MKKVTLTKKKLLGIIIICAVLTGGLTIWSMRQVAEAAILDPHPGLVGWWRFDEGTGNIAKDSSEYGNDGTVYGATWVDGKYGKALSFDGTSNYVSVLHNSVFSAPANLTVEGWFKPNTVAASYQQIVGKQTGYNEYRLILYGNTIRGQIYDSSHEYTVNSANGGVYAQAGVWHHVVMTYDGANLRLYVNGILVDTLPLVITINPNTSPLYIGINQATYYPFNGVIDEVHVYNRALSATEIQADFQKSPDFSSKLLAKVPKGTTQVITTLSWQGIGSINVTIQSPSKDYTEDIVPVYQKTVYSTSDGTSSILNIKRLSVSTTALSTDENWYVVLKFDDVEDYRITVEVQK